MPVTYQIDGALGLIRTKCAGLVTLEEVLEHFQELAQDPNRASRLAVLLDLTEMTSVPNSSQISMASSEIGGIRESVQFDACAIVACTDVLFGIARVFEGLAAEHFRAIRVFRTLAEAEKWLDSQRLTAGP